MDMSNTKRLWIVILSIFIFGVSSSIYLSGKKEVPTLVVTYNGLNVPVAKGSYKWQSRSKLKVNTIDSYAGVLNKLSPVNRVLPNEKFKLKFDYQPETITLSDGNSENGNIIQDNIINISEHNTGIYFLDCKWKEGNVTYLFYVEIQRVND